MRLNRTNVELKRSICVGRKEGVFLLESNQCGIETVGLRVVKRAVIESLNRTNVELKQREARNPAHDADA